jgi:hypothetical protein
LAIIDTDNILNITSKSVKETYVTVYSKTFDAKTIISLVAGVYVNSNSTSLRRDISIFVNSVRICNYSSPDNVSPFAYVSQTLPPTLVKAGESVEIKVNVYADNVTIITQLKASFPLE